MRKILSVFLITIVASTYNILDAQALKINTILTDGYSETGPFFEGQKRECYLVCTGEVNEIGKLYAYDEIKACADITFTIHEVLFSKDAGKQDYENEPYCMAGCLDIMPPGTKVLIFIYEQNGEYTMYNNYWSGSKSILELTAFDDPIVQSVKKYMDANQNPQILKDEVSIWEEYGLGKELENLLQKGK